MKKINKCISDADRQKTDFGFLIYTPKTMEIFFKCNSAEVLPSEI